MLDASWNRDAHRKLAVQGAERTSSELVALLCTAPREVAAHGCEHASGASDADEDIAAPMAAEGDPWPQADTLAAISASGR